MAIFHSLAQLPVAPIHPPKIVIGLDLLMVVASLALLAYLHRDPPYVWWRKHTITALDLSGFWVMAAIAQTLVPAFGPLLPLLGGSLAIVVAGLRYSRSAVALSGCLAILGTTGFALAAATPEDGSFNIGILTAPAGLMLHAATTIVTTYLVGSMMALHEDSVMRSQLSRFLAEELVDEIAHNPSVLDQESQERVATVLFADIRGFTALSERLPATEVVRFLNLFLKEMTIAIKSERGMVDKYIGDAVWPSLEYRSRSLITPRELSQPPSRCTAGCAH